MPSLITGSQYLVLIAGAGAAIGFGIGAAIYHMFKK